MSRFTLNASVAVLTVGAVALAGSLVGASGAAAAGASGGHAPAAAHSFGVQAAPGDMSVTIGLAPQSQGGLSALAAAGHVTRAQRLAALKQVEPSAATTSTVRSYLASHGLTITSSSTFTVSATGPSSTVRALFAAHAATGAARAMLATSGTRAVPTQTSRVPSPLSTAAIYALTSASSGVAVHPLDVPAATLATAAKSVAPTKAMNLPGPLTGQDFRDVYSVGGNSMVYNPEGIAIATLQFSGWDDSNLTAFAVDNGMPDPVANGQYKAISVDGASPSTPDGNNGDIEVALDQEALLTTTPHAGQEAFFAPAATANGFVDGLMGVYNAAINYDNNMNITALSISWGNCESAWLQDTGAWEAVHGAIADLNAIGVTVFASAGDSGAYDCSTESAPDDTLAVDYPSSDPGVVSVGGLTTTVNPTTEMPWWTPSELSAPNYLGSGGGGGLSTIFAQPAWQKSRYASTVRAVPDISLDADPNTGLDIVAQGADFQVGGTSLSSPIAAATLTGQEIASGSIAMSDMGDIHSALYSSPSADFIDVTSGSNGGYNAGTGYDPATGLGSPLWSKLDTNLFAPERIDDVVARDSSGYLWLYPGTGTGGFYARVLIGRGWQSMTAILGGFDLNGDQHPDVLARDAAGNMWLYPGNWNGTLGARVLVGRGWNSLSLLTMHREQWVDPSINATVYRPVVLARDSRGLQWGYPMTPTGHFTTREDYGNSWNIYTAQTGGLDFNGDGYPDVISRDTTGHLYLYRYSGNNTTHARLLIGTGWNAMSIIVGNGDYNGDGHSDLLARDATGHLWLYPGNGKGGFGSRKLVGIGWNVMTAIVGAGHLTL